MATVTVSNRKESAVFKRLNIRMPRFVQRRNKQAATSLPMWMRPEVQPIVVQSSGRSQGGTAPRSTHSRRKRRGR